MEKAGRLHRYQRKDYTDLVEFPVEIVGRDNVVRRYSFEDSVRLYRRRITFAPIRYSDADLATAEVEHCRSRIEQLRKSYFYLNGWGTPEGQPSATDSFGAYAGEVAAFLKRVFRCSGRPEVSILPVAEAADTWYVVPHGGTEGLLLYFHRFEFESMNEIVVNEDAREAFFQALKTLERPGRTTEESERLIAFHHTADCGVVLTASGHQFAWLDLPRDEGDEPIPTEPSAWEEALDMIHQGETSQALDKCRALVLKHPWHHQAYVAIALISLNLHQLDIAEEAAAIGIRYFPEDANLHLYLGVTRVRLGRYREAEPALARAVLLAPSWGSARLLWAACLIRLKQFREAHRVLTPPPMKSQDERKADAWMERLNQWLFWRWIIVLAGSAVGFAGLVAVLIAGLAGLAPLIVGMVVAGTGGFALLREVERIEQWRRYDDILLGLKRIRRVEGEFV